MPLLRPIRLRGARAPYACRYEFCVAIAQAASKFIIRIIMHEKLQYCMVSSVSYGSYRRCESSVKNVLGLCSNTRAMNKVLYFINRGQRLGAFFSNRVCVSVLALLLVRRFTAHARKGQVVPLPSGLHYMNF